MYLKKIEMENFKKHEWMCIDITDPGLTLITGPNGSGKSSLFDAVLWCLYGDVSSGNISADSVVNTKVGKNCSVKLYFYDDDNEVIFESYRNHSKFKNERFIYHNGVNINLKSKEYYEYVERFILPVDLFKQCIFYSVMFDSFINISKSERMELFDKLFNMEVYFNLSEKASNKIKILEQILSDLDLNKIRIETEINQLNKIIEEVDLHNKELEEEYKNNIRIKKEEIVNLNKLIEELENKFNKNEYEELTNKYKELYDLLKSKEFDKKSLDDKYKTLYETLKKEIESELKSEYNKLLESKKNVELEFNVLKANSELELNKNKNYYEELINKIKNNIKEYEVEKKNNKEKILKFNKELEEIKVEKEKVKKNYEIKKCYVCGQELRDNEHLNKIKNKIIELKNKFDKLMKDIKILEDKCIEIDKKLIIFNEDFKKVSKEYEEKNNELKREINKKLDEYNGIIKDLDEQIIIKKKEYEKELEEKLNKLRIELKSKYDSDVDELKREIADLTKLVGEYNNKIKIFEENIKNKDVYKSRIFNIEEIIKGLENNLKLLELENNKNKEKKELVRMKIEEIKNIEENVNKIKEDKSIMEFWKKGLSKDIPVMLVNESIPILNNIANEIIDKLGLNFYVSFSTEVINKEGKTKNEINVDAGNYIVKFKEMSSGEKRLISIIVFLTLRKFIEIIMNKKFNILFLDEVLDNLDDENSMRIVEVLNDIAFNNKYSIFLITHTLRANINYSNIITL